MIDIWVCARCSSINRQRSERCYSCGAQRDDAAAPGPDLRLESAITTRTLIPYRSAEAHLIVAAALILAVAAFGLYALWSTIGILGWFTDQLDAVAAGRQFDGPAFEGQLARADTIGWLQLGLLVPAVIAFAAWLSRVVANVPALGGGVPTTTPMRAFLYSLVPFVNLFRVPGILQDALYRLDPRAGGFFMVAAAWVGLFGGRLVSIVGNSLLRATLDDQIVALATQEEILSRIKGVVNGALVLEIVTTVMVTVGAVVLVGVMARVESRSRARDREILAAAAPE